MPGLWEAQSKTTLDLVFAALSPGDHLPVDAWLEALEKCRDANE